jgi:hypothetical protein
MEYGFTHPSVLLRVPGGAKQNVTPALGLAPEPFCAAKGYNGLSDYIQSYLRRDAVHLGLQQFELHPGA